MVVQDPEAFLRAMVAPLSRARRGGLLPGVSFSREAVANAFVMLGLLPGARAEEILGQYRPELEAEGFRPGVLTGELSVVPGALGYHEARAATRADLTGIPLAVAAGPVPIAFGGTELVLTLATLTPGGVSWACAPPYLTRVSRPVSCLAELASARSVTIATGEDSVELDVAKIVAAVADALLWTGALPPDSALLSGREAPTPGWQEELAGLWGRQAPLRARENEPERAGLAVSLPLRRATAVIESIAAHDDLVTIQLYGHPWVGGEYWPMIVPSFRVGATDDTGAEHEGMPGSGGGRPEGSREFWFWPPVPPTAQRIRVTVSTLWEAAWAELDIPGRSR